MQSLSRIRLLLAFAVLAGALTPGGTIQAQAEKKKAITKDVSFQTFDGVKIEGTLYPNPGGKREGVVMLLHDFDIKKGGSSQQPGWADLAAALQAEGFTVLSFDFRGFGNSKSVEKEFWSKPHNGPTYIKRRGAKAAETIDHKDFNSFYLRYLVNDIAAAKAYLDRRNDQKELNSSSVVVIGAGQGATLGAMWLANECRRKRDTNVPPMRIPALASQAEINDIACAVWLTISPTLGASKPPLSRWLVEAGKKNKVPMAFIYGKGDSKGAQIALDNVNLIKSKTSKGKEGPITGSQPIPNTKLTGNLLLDKELETEKWIIGKYLEPVLEARGSKEQKDRKSEASQYYYINPLTGQVMRGVKPSKLAGAEAPEVDVRQVWPQ